MKKTYYILSIALLLAGCAGSDKAAREEHAQRVEESYAYLKAHRQLPVEVDLAAEAAWLEGEDEFVYAGEAYYALGAYENLVGADSTAMHHLKQAERCWQKAPDAPDALQGMTYYKQGRISENEDLTEVALFHYRRALPYLLRANDSLYLSSVYREIARMTTDTAEQRECFMQAVSYAEALSESLQLDTRYAMLSALDPTSEERYAISRQLCDSAGMHRYAADLVRQALNQKDLSTAHHYLEILARDTTEQTWSRNQYALLQARYLYLSGRTAEAYGALESLYQQRIGSMEAEGAARSFTIAERFDNAAERERNLRLQLSKQRLIFLLVAVAIAILVGLGILYLIVRLRRNQRHLQQLQTEAHIASLESSIEEKQGQLRTILLRRISTADKRANIFANEADWNDFCSTFNAAYNNRLTDLSKQYPNLTTADLQVIVLTYLGLDISDICLLLNQSKRTIWNRRQRIKEHVNLPQEMLLEDMLRKIFPMLCCVLVLCMASCSAKDWPNITPGDDIGFEYPNHVVYDTITPPNNPLTPGHTDPVQDTLFYVGVLDMEYNEHGGKYCAVLRGMRDANAAHPEYDIYWVPSGNIYYLLDHDLTTFRFDNPLLQDIPVGNEILYVGGVLQKEPLSYGRLELEVDTIIRTDSYYHNFLPD